MEDVTVLGDERQDGSGVTGKVCTGWNDGQVDEWLTLHNRDDERKVIIAKAVNMVSWMGSQDSRIILGVAGGGHQ